MYSYFKLTHAIVKGYTITIVFYCVQGHVMALNMRLSMVAEGEGLIAEEQGGFRKMRGCRDQVLSLVLYGQMEMLKTSSGMMAVFIDFSKAYDRIDRGILWKCLPRSKLQPWL